MPPALRTYQLCTLLHKLPSELDDENALLLDELLACEDAIKKGQNAAQERANRG